MDIEPEQVKTEPPEDAGLCEELEIELGPVKYENGQVPADRDSLKCGEVKVEPTLTVEHGMQLPSDMAGPAVTIKEEPQDLEEADDFAEPGDVDFEGVKIKNETAEPEEKEEEPVPSSSSVSRKYTCCCGAVYHSKGDLNRHTRTHLDNSPAYFLRVEIIQGTAVSSSRVVGCSLCDYRASAVHKVKSHFRNCHSEENPFSCEFCTYKFKSELGLKFHLTSVHSQRSYLCKLCDYTSSNASNLRKHMRFAKHEYLCTKCDFKCSIRQMLFKHSEERHPPLFECYHCTYKTENRKSIIPHVRSHMGRRPYMCEYCPKTFSTSTIRLCHTRRNHTSCDKLSFFSMDNF